MIHAPRFSKPIAASSSSSPNAPTASGVSRLWSWPAPYPSKEIDKLRTISLPCALISAPYKEKSVHVLDLARRRSKRFLRQRRGHEFVEFTIEHARGVRGLHACAKVLPPRVRLQHIRADLMAPADISLGSLIGGCLLFTALQFDLIKPCAQHVPRLSTVLMLGTPSLTDHGDASRDVRKAHSGFRLVDVLAACAARPHRIHAHIRFIDVDLDRVGDHRENRDARKRRVPPRVRIERRNSHETMHARLGLEPAIGVVAADLNRRGFNARLFALSFFKILDLEALALGPARVHAQ